MKKRFDIVVVGGLNTDYLVKVKDFPDPGQTVPGGMFQQGPGGKGANQAVAAARLGASVAFIGKTGRDDRGAELIRGLKAEGVSARFVFQDKKAPSGAALIVVDATGEKQIAAAPGANDHLSLRELRSARKLIESARVLLMQFEVPMPVVLEAARIARKAGALVVLDPAPARKMPRELFGLVDVIRPNSDEAAALTGIVPRDKKSARRAAQALLRRGVKVAVLQAGDQGDLLASPEREIWLPRLKVKSVDATGAGDAFAAGLATGLGEGKSLEDTARLANATAALATTKVGAQPALPTRAEVHRLLRKNT